MPLPTSISVILSENRPALDAFRDGDAVVGPPLTRSVASYLKEAGVMFALAIFETGKHPPKTSISCKKEDVDVDLCVCVCLAMPVDYRIHDLGPEAGWAAKYAHISQEDSVRLVTSRVESILGLDRSRDLVVFEGNPLGYGASVVLSFHADGGLGSWRLLLAFLGRMSVGVVCKGLSTPWFFIHRCNCSLIKRPVCI